MLARHERAFGRDFFRAVRRAFEAIKLGGFIRLVISPGSLPWLPSSRLPVSLIPGLKEGARRRGSGMVVLRFQLGSMLETVRMILSWQGEWQRAGQPAAD
jgi:hypothetical protein